MPNNDYVKREDIYLAVTEIAKEIVFGNQDDDKVVDIVNSIPAADVEPVRHGRWIDKSDDEYAYCENVYQCSVCGEEWDILEGTPKQNSYHYCPNCGAKMDAEPLKEEENV